MAEPETTGPDEPRDLRRKAEREVAQGERGQNESLRSAQAELESSRDRLDVSDRARAEQAHRESEERFRQVAENIEEVFFLVTPDWNEVLYISPAYEEVWGRSCRSLYDAGRTWLEAVVEEDRPVLIASMERAIAGDLPQMFPEYRIRRPDGMQRWIHARGWPIVDSDGNVYRVAGIAADITERKRAEEALRESRDQLQAIYDSTFDGLLIADVETRRFVGTNDALCRMLGYTAEEMLSMSLSDLHPPGALPVMLEQFPASPDAGFRVIEGAPVLAKDGTVLRMDISGRCVVYGGRLCAVGFFHDVTRRIEMERELQQATLAAEAANKAKSRFLANMSHELRTPMNAILGMIDVALSNSADPTLQDCLQTAKESADILLMLLNDLLDSAKIESGKLELESAPFSLRRMLDQITRALSVRASEKGLSFSCRVPVDTPNAVVGDRLRLQQVLLNLAGNAIKFTDRGEVEISLRAVPQLSAEVKDATLEFAVRDTGIGIPPSDVELLFQPFGQADASTARRFGGTGLGLSISKSLVELMGGTIRVESEVGCGSTFSFTLALPLAEKLPADLEAAAPLPAACAPLRILLVEDNLANRKLATYVLQNRGHTVHTAADGREAVSLAQQNRYDVILMDVQMPGMDGLEATAAIRKREAGGSRVPVIAMTAHAMKEDRDRCLAAGMDGYLAKPIEAQEMIGLVESLARGAAPQGQLIAGASGPSEAPPQAPAAVFDPDGALSRCFNSADMVRNMIQDFRDEAEGLLQQMRAALANGDLAEVGRLGHRMKGTIVYLGAHRAKEAVRRVERFGTSNGGTPSEAEDAINALERECQALEAALHHHPLAAEPKQST